MDRTAGSRAKDMDKSLCSDCRLLRPERGGARKGAKDEAQPDRTHQRAKLALLLPARETPRQSQPGATHLFVCAHMPAERSEGLECPEQCFMQTRANDRFCQNAWARQKETSLTGSHLSLTSIASEGPALSYVVLPTRILLRSDADFIPCTDGDIGEIDTAQEDTAGFVEEISTCGE